MQAGGGAEWSPLRSRKRWWSWNPCGALLDAGVVVITVGGGGIPVIDRGEGEYAGTAAVIDKDFASSLLAQLINADLLLISTAVEKVALNFGKPDQRWIDRMTLEEARAYLAEGSHFAKGSMAPKIQAIIWFLEEWRQAGLDHQPGEYRPGLKR
jgi:carbamate kinase